MAKVIFLDSAPMGLLAKPVNTPEVRAISIWAADCVAVGHRIVVPEIVDYAVRRELLRSRKNHGVFMLDNLGRAFSYVPLTSTALLRAAELWAQTRQQGQPTSHDENIDVDVILAAQALTFDAGADEIIVATGNLRHLSQFVAADLWQNIMP